MPLCHNCFSLEAKNVFVNEIFNIGGKQVLVENIPVIECKRCGEKHFSQKTTENIRKLVHGKSQKAESTDVFTYVE